MSTLSQGRAVILNIMHTPSRPELETHHGSQVDVKRLHLLFEQLGFDVTEWIDMLTQV